MKTYKKIIIVIAVIFILIFIYYIENLSDDGFVTVTVEDSLRADIEELTRQNNIQKDEINRLNAKLEDLQRDYDNDEDLIDLLREQLENLGVEPLEL